MVDIVHHALIGGAGFMVAASMDRELAGAAFLAASMFPDLDDCLQLQIADLSRHCLSLGEFELGRATEQKTIAWHDARLVFQN